MRTYNLISKNGYGSDLSHHGQEERLCVLQPVEEYTLRYLSRRQVGPMMGLFDGTEPSGTPFVVIRLAGLPWNYDAFPQNPSNSCHVHGDWYPGMQETLG
jgi:hypothetical protein